TKVRNPAPSFSGSGLGREAGLGRGHAPGGTKDLATPPEAQDLLLLLRIHCVCAQRRE
ncbi:Hypothetical predicted protein, partial [Marmota monax]